MTPSSDIAPAPPKDVFAAAQRAGNLSGPPVWVEVRRTPCGRLVCAAAPAEGAGRSAARTRAINAVLRPWGRALLAAFPQLAPVAVELEIVNGAPSLLQAGRKGTRRTGRTRAHRERLGAEFAVFDAALAEIARSLPPNKTALFTLPWAFLEIGERGFKTTKLRMHDSQLIERLEAAMAGWGTSVARFTLRFKTPPDSAHRRAASARALKDAKARARRVEKGQNARRTAAGRPQPEPEDHDHASLQHLPQNPRQSAGSPVGGLRRRLPSVHGAGRGS